MHQHGIDTPSIQVKASPWPPFNIGLISSLKETEFHKDTEKHSNPLPVILRPAGL
jgi:hypothetical protein